MNRTAKLIDGLYRLPLREFIAGRNALARKLEAGGDAPGAARVRELAKPGLPAWAVNQLHGSHRRLLDRLLQTGRELAKLHGSGAGDPAALRRAAGRRRDILTELLGHAEEILRSAGHAASASTLRRIERTLEAIALAGGKTEEPLGRMSRDREPGGFDPLLSLAAAAPGRRHRSPGGKRKTAGRDAPSRGAAERRSARERARTRLRRARRELQAAERAAATSVRAEERAEAELDRARRRVEEARDGLRDAAAARSRADDSVEHARAELAEAEESAAAEE